MRDPSSILGPAKPGTRAPMRPARPIPMPGDDPRVAFGLRSDVREVLERQGYPPLEVMDVRPQQAPLRLGYRHVGGLKPGEG